MVKRELTDRVAFKLNIEKGIINMGNLEETLDLKGRNYEN